MFVLLVSLLVSAVTAAPTGAPDAICTSQPDMQPQHVDATGNLLAPQPLPAPGWTLTSAPITGGYRLTLSASSTAFQGFFIQARINGVADASTTRGFVITDAANSQLRPCAPLSGTRNGVTHTNAVAKTRISVDWTTTEPLPIAGLTFVVTSCENHDRFWVKWATITP